MFRRALLRPPVWSNVCSQCLRKPSIQFQLRKLVTTGTATQTTPDKWSLTNFGTDSAARDDKLLREVFDKPEAWKQFRNSTASAPATGLFQNKDLINPAGFVTYTRRMLKRAERLVDVIVNSRSKEELRAIVKNMDRLSDLLCQVIDMSDFIRSTHPDRKICMAADKAYTDAFEYMNVLNTTSGIYEALNKAFDDPEIVNSWNAEEKAVASILHQDHEKSGINLPEKLKRRFIQLSNEIAQVGTQFVNTMAPAEPFLVFESSRLKGMDPMVVRELTARGRVVLPTHGLPAIHALRTVDDEYIRQELYTETRRASPRNIKTLEEMLKLRTELAHLTGHENFAQRALVDKMAKTPESVMTFLDSLAKANLPAAQKEFTDLANFKLGMGHQKPLQAWDRDYYSQKLHLSRKGMTRGSESISDYFSLGTVMQGLNRLFTRLYGLRLVPRSTLPGEAWNDDVRRLDVVSDSEGHVAVLYCDLFERNGKSPNPAHFTIRCSRKIQDVERSEQDDITTDGMAYGRRPDGSIYQLPTIALICDFTRGAYSRPTLLNFREVQTLFHEMGHALHSIIGRTELHNVAGTRCATDFAELPSVLMEYFAKAPEVLSLYARHYETDEPLPIKLLEENLKTHATFESIETRTQIILAILDQQYHGNLPSKPGFDSTDVYQDVLKAYDVFPPMTGTKTSWQGFFGHLFGYGALYYSYLFDQAIAAKVWKDVFEKNPVDRDGGELWKSEVLRFGGSRDPWHSVAKVLKMDKLADGGVEAMKEVGTWGRELK